MLKYILFLLLGSSFVLNAQDSLRVKLSDNSDYKQLMLYKVKGVQQEYVANAKSENQIFKFQFPKESESGIYRLFFDIQNNGFIEFLYNHESISLSFDPKNIDTSANYTESKENQIYEAYIQTSLRQQTSIDSLQRVYFEADEPDAIRERYAKLVQDLNQTQHSFEEMSNGLMAHDFIIARRNYNAEEIWTTPEAYLEAVQGHFFDALDFGNPVLRNSSIILDKVVEYVFYMHDSDDMETYQALKQKAINEVMVKVGNHFDVKGEILSSLLFALAGQQEVEMVRFIREEHYAKLPSEFQSERFLGEIERMLVTAIGNDAPEIEWKENGIERKLSDIKGLNEVVIVTFWSTGCSHCLNDIPKLYDFTKDYDGLQIIAVALEEEREDFDALTKEMPLWTHIYGANKWENKIAQDYDVNGTPSYFVLNKNLKIIAKPEELQDLQALFDQN